MKVYFLEAVDQSLRANRLMKIYNYMGKKNRQADRLYSKSIGYRKDRTKQLPGNIGHPTVKNAAWNQGSPKARKMYRMHFAALKRVKKAAHVFHKGAAKLRISTR